MGSFKFFELWPERRIHKVENLQLLVTKRSKLIQTRSQLERFQIGSNDFNCNMQLKDSDGNTFTTGFTPGIKKVIDFLKASFDASIQEIENKIKFWSFRVPRNRDPFFMLLTSMSFKKILIANKFA